MSYEKNNTYYITDSIRFFIFMAPVSNQKHQVVENFLPGLVGCSSALSAELK